MGRRINTLGYHGTGGGTVDGYFDKIIKYIPADVVAAWTAAIGLITGGATPANANDTVLWVAFGVGVIVTALWTWVNTKQTGQPPPIIQTVVSTGSFIVWAFALPVGPAMALSMDAKWGSLLLIGWTLILGIIPGDPQNPPSTPTPTPTPTPPTP